MAEMNTARGSLVAIVTPMSDDGALDLDALRRLVDWHIAEGTDGIVVVGTTGESPTVNYDEHCLLIRTTVEQAAGRVPVIAGTGANSTTRGDRTDRMRQGGRRAGRPVGGAVLQQADPGRPVPALQENRRSGRPAADSLQRARAARWPTCPTTPRCAWPQVPGIVGIKDATGNMERAADLLRRAPKDFALYSGDDASAMPFMLLGGHGVISVTANVAPKLMHEMCVAAFDGNLARARELNNALLPLAQQAVCRSQSDSGQVGVRRTGTDRVRHAPAADPAVCRTARHRA